MGNSQEVFSTTTTTSVETQPQLTHAEKAGAGERLVAGEYRDKIRAQEILAVIHNIIQKQAPNN